MLSIEEGAKNIRDLILADKPFFVGRNGTIEIQSIHYWKSFRAYNSYPPEMTDLLKWNAGVFPSGHAAIDTWCKAYTKSFPLLDMTAAGWYVPTKEVEDELLSVYSPNVARCPLRSLEPYYVVPALQWTRALAGKKVAIVSSFTKTIKAQLTKKVWTGVNEGLIPSDVEWSFVQTGYSHGLALGTCEWPSHITTWGDAVNHVVKEVIDSGSKIAIIGCGGLGMVIGGRLKAAGISAIVVGGAIQVIFGIKGRRWATHDIISKFWNDEWVWPAKEEVPEGALTVEGGCYWG